MAVGLTILIYTLQVVFTILSFFFLALQMLKKPFSFYKTKTRNGKGKVKSYNMNNFFNLVPPPCLLDPSLGTHEYISANGIKFHCVSKGDTSKPLMLFLHGFPEVHILLTYNSVFIVLFH